MKQLLIVHLSFLLPVVKLALGGPHQVSVKVLVSGVGGDGPYN